MTRVTPTPSPTAAPDLSPTPAPGPLAGLRVLEFASLGPGPHACMMLADLGADVVRLERGATALSVHGSHPDHLLRGRRSVSVDLKDAADLDLALGLADAADAVVEGLRPGVMERLGLGPDVLLTRNPRLVYARMTGWGQTGPRAQEAGHDLNYIALTGALAAIARPGQPPTVPLNLIGDFGGGSMLCLVGILSALWERERSGLGQVVDAAMVDGVASLMQLIWALRGSGQWRDEPAANLLDGAAPFYDVYPCAGGGFIAVGALEPAFYAQLLAGLGLDPSTLPAQYDRAGWPTLRSAIAARVGERTREEWTAVFSGTDACVTPVLGLADAAYDEHVQARETLVAVDGVTQAAPAPRFSRTPARMPRPPRPTGADRAEVVADWLGQ